MEAPLTGAGSSLTTGPADQESLRGFPCQRSSFFAGLRHCVISRGSRISKGSRWDENITGLGSFSYSLCQKLPVARHSFLGTHFPHV